MADIKQALQYAQQNPNSEFATELRRRIESGQMNNELKSAGFPEYTGTSTMSQKEQGYFSRVGERVKSSAQDIQSGVKAGQDIKQSGMQDIQQGGFLNTLKGLAKQKIGDVKAKLAMGGGVARGLSSTVEEAPVVKQTLEAVGGAIAPTVQSGLETDTGKKILELQQKYPEAFKSLQDVVDIASLIPVGAGAKVGVEGAELATKGALKGADTAMRITSNLIKPIPDVEKATGQILQGGTDAIKKAQKGLSLVDTKGVKTYEQLLNKIDTKIPEYAKIVDESLAKDTSTTLLKDLTTKLPTKSGGVVSTNFADTALKHLDELYSQTGDLAKRADLQDIINKANTVGLTKLELNDIARAYGSEFSEKAFNKIGEPLTSINAQLFENTRKGLKELSRSGLPDEVAKQADSAMSSLYNTKQLIKKNVEAVNKLKNRIDERGLLEKAGHFVTKYADMLTGGTVRGLVGGLLPRGAGYKTLNALDLEELLQRNLKVLREAGKAKTTKEFIEKTSELSKPLQKKSNQAGFISTGGKDLQPLYKEAQGKSLEEFVKSKLDENSFVNKEPIKVYRGEGSGIGNRTLVNGKYFADSEKFASNFGKVSTGEIPVGSKIFDLDKVKTGKGIISDEALVDPERLTNYLIDNGYEYTKNTNTRGTEYVKLARYSRSSRVYADVRDFNELNDLFGDLIDKSDTYSDFAKKVLKKRGTSPKDDYYKYNLSIKLKNYWNQVKKNDIPQLNLPKETKLEKIWKEANSKTSTKQGMTVVNPLTAIAGSSALFAGASKLSKKENKK